MDFSQQLRDYAPFNAQEGRDKAVMLRLMDSAAHLYTRDNPLCHMTASAWVVNRTRDRVLMIYHNIYRSWSWMGGHADGQTDLMAVAVREVKEESGLVTLCPVMQGLFSLEILTVDGHMKRGEYVSSHLHLNATYLLEADESEPIRVKPDENSGVRWFGLQEAVEASCEPWFRERIYTKLNQKLMAIS